MKKLFIALVFFSVWINASGQQLMVKSGKKGLYLDHTVVAKEGLFSIGRHYNVTPRYIAAYNDIDYNKGLNIGQVIRIPLTDTNFSQKSKTATPIYYKVGDKETLQKVSAANNKVAVKTVREWNKLPDDNIKSGSKLVVGFLVSENNPALAASNPVKEPAKKTTDDKPVAKNDTKTDKPVVKTEASKEKIPVKDEQKKVDPKKDEAKKTDVIAPKQNITSNMSGQGYFKSSFDQQVKTLPVSKIETVTSGVFKMVSNPQETKYYLLVDGVSSGTVVRVINPENNKTIYAKVLGEMSGIRQNQGLDIRLSNTAASSLGITDTDKFIVKINY